MVTNQRSHLVIGVRRRAVWVGRRELPHLRRHVRHHAQRRVGGCDRGAQRHTRCVVVIPIAPTVRVKVTVRGVDADVGRGVAWVLPGPHPDPIAIRITKVVHKHIAGDLVLHRVVLRHGAAVTGAGRAIGHQEQAVCGFCTTLVDTELLDAVAVGVVHRGRAQGGAVGIEGDVIAAVTGHGNVHAVHTIGQQHLACVVHAVGTVGVHIEAEISRGAPRDLARDVETRCLFCGADDVGAGDLVDVTGQGVGAAGRAVGAGGHRGFHGDAVGAAGGAQVTRKVFHLVGEVVRASGQSCRGCVAPGGAAHRGGSVAEVSSTIVDMDHFASLKGRTQCAGHAGGGVVGGAAAAVVVACGIGPCTGDGLQCSDVVLVRHVGGDGCGICGIERVGRRSAGR